ncbi:GH36-type glycosyl hydrolase domain-containing protein [Clostridium estertheticum]|uniref:Cyclic beta 1-2 glucan synthetase n=1 Tax=Clostridium estertheticum TaxID=238834 RepID=A0AA47EH98_9CLOT|nr:glucoamylase family protein [Clostridium estertheticum]MBU3154285.1 cyclic beta 1-2 glucan synthetase [Clostridium estertheticum]WAG60179.1 cyclic beta 1-2 glucan synthetase [Clostridium estertheticum]
MPYVILGAIVAISILAYIVVRKNLNHYEEENLLKDVPTINVNREDLEKHAFEISRHYSDVKNTNCKKKLISNLDGSYEKILEGYEKIDKEGKNKKEVLPAAEWLLDNLYLIEKEYKSIKYNMPQTYYKDLPVIYKGVIKGYPRVYHIAIEIVSHTDGRMDEHVIEDFIGAYQKNAVLTSGELWAIPIMLRIALIQNISKITEKIVKAEEDKKEAELVAERLINAFNEDKINLELSLLNSQKNIFTLHFTERLLKLLRDNGIDSKEVYDFIDERLGAQDTSSEKIIALEHQIEANFEISMANSINSIRIIEGLNWKKYFEKLSPVEVILREDPADIYRKMDFKSRDKYRHEIEKLSKHTKLAESYISKKAIECCYDSEMPENNTYKNHVGYYLIDDGLDELKKKIGYKSTGMEKLINRKKKNIDNVYIRTIGIVTLLIVGLIILSSLLNDNDKELWRYILAVIVILVPCSEITISILNWSISLLCTTSFIPKMDFEEEIPEKYSTVVVIPTLLNNTSRVIELIKDLEIYYLANSQSNIFFALLGDFKDSDTKDEVSDKEIVDVGLLEIEKLNKKYCISGKNIFFFLNRRRQYNEKENKWIGFERKRGKLMEFNEFLRGKQNTSYNVMSNNAEDLRMVKYVITLDSDTKLPRDSAKKLIGAMAHPLNNAVIENNKKRVSRGYGLMQPRIGVSILSANKTIFSKIFSGETGIDIYTTAVSDVYQDLFGEGIFTGKGIYNVDVFNYMLKDEIPENTVLSHDLLEGSYVRTALVTDVEFIDGYPSYYNASSMRLHRWTRGDWQLLRWLKRSSPLNKISKWKIFDNLRRSLITPSVTILLILALGGILPDSTDKWVIAAFVAILAPILFDVSEAVVSPALGVSLSGKIENSKMAIEQVFLIFCFIPYQAYMMTDAIIRTLYRVLISKKNLLEWRSAADVEVKVGKKLKNFIEDMWVGSAISVLILVISFNASMSVGFLSIPSCVIWFLSPVIAYVISRDMEFDSFEITSEEKNYLRKLSRKTWAYFEDFVNDENNWLGPDNYQEDPPNGVAHRTSPTNMGMELTSNLVAYDLGYIGIVNVTSRIDKIMMSMEDLDMYKGHFYNWYDTKTKTPLFPRYVSTVDSGNLVGYLWVVAQALDEYLGEPVFNHAQIKGLEDTMRLASEEAGVSQKVKELYQGVLNRIESDTIDFNCWKTILRDLSNKSLEVGKNEYCMESYWNKKLKDDVSRYLEEISELFPWFDYAFDKDSDLELTKSMRCLLEEATIISIPEKTTNILNTLDDKLKNDKSSSKLKDLLQQTKEKTQFVISKIEGLKEKLNSMAEATDFKMLYDEDRELFRIGYDVENDSLGKSYYDLLASESRQASFVAIAKGDIPKKHWFKLGRSMTNMGKSKGLVSWSGTMFEYMMPLLIMKNYSGTMLDETYNAVVGAQKQYCSERGVPFGISESAFYKFDINSNYQYKAFGVAGVGLKSGLENELVISPYSTVMALQTDFRGAYDNLKRLTREGLEGNYGFYEAVDYTKNRMFKDDTKAIIKCFMIHHEGMSLMALDNVLLNNILQKRFHALPKVKATELLLQEKISKRVVYDRERKFKVLGTPVGKQKIIVRKYTTAKTETPETHLISNGNYSLMISNSGSGYALRDKTMIYRWKEDVTKDNTGMFVYIKDMSKNEFFSVAYEPCKKPSDSYEVTFALDKAEFERRDKNVVTRMEITVATEDDSEVRRLSIINKDTKSKIFEITSYFEVTLAHYDADIVHPAFGNLFVKTEYVDNPSCIIATRRPRSKGEKQPWVMQTVATQGNTIGTIQYETSRANFIGRGENIIHPIAMRGDLVLSNTVGAVLDPIVSIRRRVKIKPGETCIIAFTTSIANTKEEVISLAKKYSEFHNINRVFELAWSQTQVDMKYLGIKSTQANLYQVIASKILFLNSTFRQREKYIKNVKKGQFTLWGYGISGDLPIILLIVRESKDKDLVRQLINAHEYLSLKGLRVDLVIINLQMTSYDQPLQADIKDLVGGSHLRDKENKPGGLFILNKANIKDEDIDLLIAIARLVIDSCKGMLVSQIQNKNKRIQKIPLLQTLKKEFMFKEHKFNIKPLEYFNGLGGFDVEGENYTILLKDFNNTPAPWINVISNGDFGFHVSECGSAYTWNSNSRENKITTWSNDWISDECSEAIYLRDDNNGSIWSITPKPIRDGGEYLIEHGFGYSNFKHEAFGIMGEVTMFVPMEHNVKLCKIKLKNNSDIPRDISITYYAELVMGVVPQHTAQHIVTYINEEQEYMYATNCYNQHFGKLKSYLKLFGGYEQSFTGDRSEFLGRGGSIENPEVLKRIKLSNNVGAGLDPCLAVTSKIHLEPNMEIELIAMLGENENLDNISKVAKEFEDYKKVDTALENVKKYWNRILHTIQVKTPDKSMDLMLNGWLMYQTIVCRLWARTAFYQSGGAYGFRDQLQDVMSLSMIEPSMTRKQILYSASRQFVEGDVQHWWHPVVDSGIRTRFSDDLLWLPYVTMDYIKNTGDFDILNEQAEYLMDTPLAEGEDERYNISGKADFTGSIYEHCIKAIEKALKFGSHNIPLMGSGDWNDGMSTVGNKGKGESVWLGWFLYDILADFSKACTYENDDGKLKKYKDMQEYIRINLEDNAWDGNWYRRAYFDDGTPLGSSQNEECKIDSLSQSWAVISGAANKERATEAMKSLERYLIKEDNGMILLLTPPFSKSSLEPGYIKGYVPGVRENGGQYTHAATWVILAFAKLYKGDTAAKLYNMINPINHTKTLPECERFKTEPYVMTADVYGKEPHVGRGGWSWYTGTSGWMYRTGIEAILGLKLKEGKGFTIKPCVPEEWPNYEIIYKKDNYEYIIEVKRIGDKGIWLDGKLCIDGLVPFINGVHKVEVII